MIMTFEEIVKKPQQALKRALISELGHIGYNTCTKHGFLYAKGKLPVLLVAHMDTVHREPVKEICCSSDKKIIMSPQGIGGDDRAGVYMVLEIIKKHRCHVLFCEDEEIGGIGAQKFLESGIRPKVSYIVELDRRGSDDAVFYDCANPDFTAFICRFGFKEELGSFSDISVIAPELGIAAVNISAGYYNEHTLHEYVDMSAVQKNIERVGKMVATPSDQFEYKEAIRLSRRDLAGTFDYGRWHNDIVWKYHAGETAEIRQLKATAEQFGVSNDEVDLLLDCDYSPDEIELLLNSPTLLRKSLYQAMFEENIWE